MILGSPPHTWRIPRNYDFTDISNGITSTHVENTLLQVLLNWCLGDHLHTRGEYNWRLLVKNWRLGSPPHTWRIHENKSLLYVAERITSTHVENTVPAPLKTAIYLGSPPHTWRIHSFAKNHAIVTGITSTHVENTVNKSQYNNNHKTIDPKISSLCQLLLYLFLSH